MNRSYLILIGVIVVLAVGLIGLLLYINSQPDANRGITPLVEISPMEPDSEQWGVNFPNQYTTLLKTETNDVRTAFGGSNPYSKLEQDCC
jgi:nitrite reductase (cytochrome c-552)